MKPFKLVYMTLTVVVGLALLVILLGAEKGPKRTENEVFMRAKLIYSEGILEGLALEKFDMVSKNAVKLRDMTQSNAWFTIKNQDYLTHTTNYYRAIDKLYLAAVDRKLDDATEAYVKVARACVECHRLVRLEQHAKTLETKGSR